MATFDHSRFLKTLSTRPGVYRMFNASGTIIYVGKAKNLKKRVSSYFRRTPTDNKTHALVKQIANIEVTITQTESEALILENTLIKRHKPRYNIFFKDDKSYPYLLLSAHDYPRLSAYRGSKRVAGECFGPYPNMGAAKATLDLMQKLFHLRQCRDSMFEHRQRPCLQYQIKRCSAPCVNKISQAHYQADVEQLRLFLQGKNQQVMQQLADAMTTASDKLHFEEAASYRDRLQLLQKLQQQQYAESNLNIDADIIAIAEHSIQPCLTLLMIRNGNMLGTRHYFPNTDPSLDASDIISAFIHHYYLNPQSQNLPQEVITDHPITIDSGLIENLSNQKLTPPQWKHKVKSTRAKWLNLAKLNAQQALQSHLKQHHHYDNQWQQLPKAIGFPHNIHRIECFDISHHQGEATTASCVVFDSKGAQNQAYRRFHIKDIQANDDYAAIEQAVYRRYKRLLAEDYPLPEIVFIDGGLGQLHAAEKAFKRLDFQAKTSPVLIAIAKGPSRKPGMEQFWRLDQELPFSLPADNEALHLIQHIRDESHRFAITGLRQQRQKKRTTSSLQEIEGIGPKRRQALLHHFGGWQGLQNATLEELSKIPGISQALAKKILLSLKP